MKRVLISVGTRPNIIKITQFKKLAASFDIDLKILHTGQHYDHKMAQVFYDQFGIQPDFKQELKPGTVLEQITQMMLNIAKVLKEYKPDVLLTPGDVNSTFAAAYAGYHEGVSVGHIESGLRSEDRSMPEEINRMLTDEITDEFFITEKSGIENLKALGKRDEHLHFVGNTMLDTLVAFESEINASKVLSELGIKDGYALFTFHRPGNVDNETNAYKLFTLLTQVSKQLNVVFPAHPRTQKMLREFGLWSSVQANDNIYLTGPQDYFSFQHLVKNATVVITDSGGIQEETTFRQVPCLTVRPNTERPITVEIGTNELLDFNVALILERVAHVKQGKFKKGQIPELWDGQSTHRILEVLA